MSRAYNTQLRNLNDINFGLLNSSKKSNVIKYDHNLGKFILISADSVLSEVDNFDQQTKDTVLQQINPDNLTLSSIDGGSI